MTARPWSWCLASAVVALAASSRAEAPSPGLVERGAYLARASDCVACHTAPGGVPFAGGLAMRTPIGTVISTNITPDLETGIGRYTLEDFVRALREGVARDGHHLYPAMPYPSYTRMTPADLEALYAYFLHGVEPVEQHTKPTALPWPLSMRGLLGLWNALNLRPGPRPETPEHGEAWTRGAYLVQGPGHCGDCHTPRGCLAQVRASDEREGDAFLAGATLDLWRAGPLTGGTETGLGGWSREALIEYLRTGRTEHAAAAGPMAGVIQDSTQYLTEADLAAIAEYLQSPPVAGSPPPPQERSPADAAATLALRDGDTSIPGARLYLDNCNACHRSDGAGASRTFPDLARSAAVASDDPTTLLHVVLTGSAMPSTQTAPTAFAMPGLGWRLNDAEVAEVATFVRASWGNHAGAVRAAEVARLRQALPPPSP
jgi:mono/diheme cytochrome c family protein